MSEEESCMWTPESTGDVRDDVEAVSFVQADEMLRFFGFVPFSSMIFELKLQ